MIIRNIDPAAGLCNGTRMQIIKLTEELLYCRMLTGPKADANNVYLIRREKFEYGKQPNERGIPFRRVQFPVRLCFAMTINKVFLLLIIQLKVICMKFYFLF